MIESNVDGQARWKSALMDNYGTPGLALVRGEGAHVWDADGNRYLDLVGGIATTVLGHAHPAVVAAVTAQIATMAHVSNLYINPVAVELAEALLDVAGLTGDAKVLFCNSGAEANEAAFKLARLTGRRKVVAAEGAFHGRTMGSLSLTGQPTKRDPFQPLVPGVEHVPFGDVDALRAAVDADTAAVILEPVLGEGGVVPAPDGYLQAAREITTAAGALLVLDEIQTGIGRLGSWFAFQQAGITPDVVTLAKGLGGGLPLGACVAVGAAADLFAPGHHGTTFGGNAVCAAAGLAVIRTIANEGLLDHVATLGKDISARIEQLDHPLVSGVRGRGLLLGVGLARPAAGAVAAAAAAQGFLVNNVQPDAIRLAPPLILTDDQADEFVAALPAILDTAEKGA
ncbi:acetylornithine transaminase [Actinokineospora inagensis]|uniref:acetylornithine transaminase n=1 Tax=Actinokineospora inagensis TaxID=103730 RepID=UPI00040786DA|nr:acetylornithine transaminase [Actinokineospora inagensis]